MAWVMSTQIPVALNHQFEMFQGTVTTGAGQKFPVINPVSCNASDRPLCAALRTRMCNLVRKGFALAPAPWGGRSGDSWNAGCLDSQSAAVAQSMQTAPAASPGQADDDARLHRLLAAINDDALWTCPNKFSAGIIPEESFCPPAPSPCGVCAFSPPIRRLIVKQDSLQFVLYDGPEYDNASLALSYAIVGLLGGGRVGTAQYPSVICDDVRRLNNYSSNFYRTPNIFYLRNACGCPTESVPNPLNPSLWNPQTDVGGVPLGAGGDYSQACLCPQGQHESFGLCCANNQSNCKGNCASSAC